jgi:hypothetical protein
VQTEPVSTNFANGNQTNKQASHENTSHVISSHENTSHENSNIDNANVESSSFGFANAQTFTQLLARVREAAYLHFNTAYCYEQEAFVINNLASEIIGRPLTETEMNIVRPITTLR